MGWEIKNNVEIKVIKNDTTGKIVPITLVTEYYGNKLKITFTHYGRNEVPVNALIPLQNLPYELYREEREELLSGVIKCVKTMSEEELNNFEFGPWENAIYGWKIILD